MRAVAEMRDYATACDGMVAPTFSELAAGSFPSASPPFWDTRNSAEAQIGRDDDAGALVEFAQRTKSTVEENRAPANAATRPYERSYPRLTRSACICSMARFCVRGRAISRLSHPGNRSAQGSCLPGRSGVRKRGAATSVRKNLCSVFRETPQEACDLLAWRKERCGAVL